jgi:cytochrome c2
MPLDATGAGGRAIWVLVVLALMGGCDAGSRPPPPQGDAARGRMLLHQYGCGYCHRIPGVDGARGDVGPPLDDVGRRVYLAGSLPNTPQAMAQWIRFPQSYRPGTVMPDLNVSAEDARDMVAHLYRLR